MPRDLPLGNGSLLVNFDRDYRVRDIYWPHVGLKNHTKGSPCRFGIWVDGRFRWSDDPGWQRYQGYLHDSLVTDVRMSHHELDVKLAVHDLVDFHENIFLRRLSVESLDGKAKEVRFFFAYDFSIDGYEVGDSAYYEPERKAVFHYKGKTWFLIGSGRQKGRAVEVGVDSWAVGNKNIHGLEGTWKDAEDGLLSRNSVTQGSVDSVICLNLRLDRGEAAIGWHWFCVGEDFVEVTRLNRIIREKGPNTFFERTRDYWQLWANKEDKGFSGLSANVCAVCRRSLLIMRTQIDNEGAVIAANDHDFIHFANDTYSYMWPRDGALVVSTYVEVGYSEVSRRFFDFCHRVITREGYLLHKYNPDGSLASSWHGWYQDGRKRLPVQEDETALVLWALWQHFDRFRDVEFIKPHYRGLILRAANWLLSYRDRKSGLVLPSWDLWEERYGVHAWTVGAVWAGLTAAANFAGIFGQHVYQKDFAKAADSLLKAVRKHMWSKSEKRFVRSLVAENNDSHPDLTMDASLVGLWYFGMFSPDDPQIVSTMEIMQQRLRVNTGVGGMARYENDYYHQVSKDLRKVPGNPWFISTLWLAQWQIAVAKTEEDLEEPLALIEWAGNHALTSGVLAEQIHPFTHEPLSVSPLTWSHATMVATVRQFMARSEELQGKAAD